MKTDWTVSIIFIMVSIILILIVLLIRAFFFEVRKGILNYWIKIKFIYQKYKILFLIGKKLRNNELSYSVNIIFQLFCQFYEIHYQEMKFWSFDVNNFPNGFKEISDMYRWIKKIRIDNYTNVRNISKFNENIKYWEGLYNAFKFYINKKGELNIIPVNNYKTFVYERMMLKLYNTLYKLDTEKVMWIMERRKFFGF